MDTETQETLDRQSPATVAAKKPPRKPRPSEIAAKKAKKTKAVKKVKAKKLAAKKTKPAKKKKAVKKARVRKPYKPGPQFAARVDVRLSKAMRAKLVAKAKKLGCTVTSLVLRGIAKVTK